LVPLKHRRTYDFKYGDAVSCFSRGLRKGSGVPGSFAVYVVHKQI
jgi:hypothetical protein